MELINKSIWLISPQEWGTMKISKHHYALTLAKNGNKVYFIEPPVFRGWFKYKKPIIRACDAHPSLYIVTSSLRLPYFFKFHFKELFYYFIRKEIRSLAAAVGVKPDIIWSFDLSNVFPLRYFNGGYYRIFHPVDMPWTTASLSAAEGADIVFSTSPDILEKYSSMGIPSFLIEHGLAEEFISVKTDTSFTRGPIRIGYSGNLLRHDVDRSGFLKIVGENPSVIFECWGSSGVSDRNLGGHMDDSTQRFITELISCPNVIIHGSVPTDVLARSILHMDGFLVCYDLDVLNPIGPNYHKLMEFFSTGKVVISSYIKHYADRPDLIQMAGTNGVARLSDLFRSVITNLAFHNSDEKMRVRREWAFSNTYNMQIGRIEKRLDFNH
jgi:hypothetical protein